MNLGQNSPGLGRRAATATPYCGATLVDALTSLPCPRRDVSELQVRRLSGEHERAAHAACVSALMRARVPWWRR